MPTAPVPAYKSSQADSSSAAGSPEHRTLNRVSRSRSAVGRISIPDNDRNIRRRYSPAMTLIILLAARVAQRQAASLQSQPFRFFFSHLREASQSLTG